MATKECRRCNLPQQDDYHVWSKQLLRDRIGRDSILNTYLTEDKQYCINSNTLALYEFQHDPLLNRYKSVIFDANLGIVLSPRSSRALVTAFSKECLLAGLEFQRDFARRIRLTSRNVIATGRLAYFSMRSYNSGNVDWVALHQMMSFNLCGGSTIRFVSLNSGKINYVFSFNNCSRYIHNKVLNSLLYNHALHKVGTVHLEQLLGWQVKQVRGQSLIDQADYYHPHQSLDDISLQQIIQDLLDKKHARYVHHLAAYLELPYLVDIHRFIYQLSQRPDTLY